MTEQFKITWRTMATGDRTMKVLLELVARVTYSAQVELTQAEFDAYEARLKSARGFDEDRIAQELAQKARIDLADPSDWGELSVATFDPALTA